ncbi:MAG: outer membrane protein assembly factor BamD [Hyphomicrobiales bacterium]
MLRKLLVSIVLVSPVILAGCSVIPFADRFGVSDKSSSAKSSKLTSKENKKLAALSAKAELPPSVLLNSGIKNVNKGDAKTAQEAFDQVNKLHPFSTEAQRSLVLSAYTHFASKQYEQTITKAEQFIQLYPGNKDAAYMQYLIGESYSSNVSSVVLDQGDTAKGLQAYRDLVRLYPDSKYASDAKRKVFFLADQLAGKEMQIGRYYQERSQHLAAVNRFRTVVDRHQTTRHVEEALYRLTESYLSLGLVNDAKSATSILGHNYPESQWYSDAYSLTTGSRVASRRQGVGSRIAGLVPFVGKKGDESIRNSDPDFVPAEGILPAGTQPVFEKKRGLSRLVPFLGGKNEVATGAGTYSPPSDGDFVPAGSGASGQDGSENVSFPPVPGLDDITGQPPVAPESVFVPVDNTPSTVPGVNITQDVSFPSVPGLESANGAAGVPAPTGDNVFLPAPGSQAVTETAVAEEKKKGLSRFVPFIGDKDK